MLGLAQTGTGKTAAFALPILERLLERRAPGPRALVVAPTRELAKQIEAEFRALGRHGGARVLSLFGGVGLTPQIRALRQGADVLVACPGRLLDLVSRGAVRLDRVEVLVLDEADHMFDMGFLPDVRRILAALPAKRQNLLFSATMPREIRHLADALLQRPKVVELAHSRPAETIEHALYPVRPNGKTELLHHLLAGDDFTSGIVFLRTKHRAKRLAQSLDRDGHRAVALQGNMSQPQRDRAMRGFRDGRFDVLVATDIAARGIDVAAVSHVINFDVPNTPDAYTHRIGRTGRSERSGRACTFVTRDDAAMVRAIERHLGEALPLARVPGLTDASQHAASPTDGPRRGGRSPAASTREEQAGRRGTRGRRTRGKGSKSRGASRRSATRSSSR